jgi:cysteinyl-tRNA synthetase
LARQDIASLELTTSQQPSDHAGVDNARTSSAPRHRVLQRAIAGLFILTAITAVSAWLLHASIDPVEEHGHSVRMSRHELLGGVRTWGYQLQGLDVARAAAAPHDLLVVDEDFLGRHAPRSARDALVGLKRKPDGQRRLVLAYLSIGEAENYRAYWNHRWIAPAKGPQTAGVGALALPLPQPKDQSGRMANGRGEPAGLPRHPGPEAPGWLAAENPDWRGNYAVRFWDDGWQRHILGSETSALERIIAAGFDGVYLDRADVWSQWIGERATARADMTAFIEAISARARALSPGFVVVMQNAEELLSQHRVQAALDAVAKEDLLFGVDGAGKANDEKDVAASVRYLRKAQRNGLPILVVEYLADPAMIAAASSRIEALGFVPSFAPRALDALGGQPSPR